MKQHNCTIVLTLLFSSVINGYATPNPRELNPDDFWKHYPSDDPILTSTNRAYIKDYSERVSSSSIKIIVDDIIKGGRELGEARTIIYALMVLYIDHRDHDGVLTAIRQLSKTGSEQEKEDVRDFAEIVTLSPEDRKKLLFKYEQGEE